MLGLSVAPPQVAGNAPRCVITGAEEVLIEGHTGLFSYETERIRVRTEKGLWTVTGRGLIISFFGVRDLLIRGEVTGIEMEGAT